MKMEPSSTETLVICPCCKQHTRGRFGLIAKHDIWTPIGGLAVCTGFFRMIKPEDVVAHAGEL